MRKLNLDLRVSSDPEEIRRLVAEGAFCPIECSIGGESITDSLLMDHHGELSDADGVAIRAYRDSFGVLKDKPFFVTCSPVDADACFATAALAGLLPHPSREGPPWLKTDLTELAESINKLDVEPIGLNPLDLPGGDKILAWDALVSGSNRDDLGYMAGVGLWVQLTTAASHLLAPLLEGVKKSEEERRKTSSTELSDKLVHGKYDEGLVVALYETTAWGFDCWYNRRGFRSGESKSDANTVAGWWNPVVLALAERSREITVGCPNQAVAEELFGEGGLKNVFAQLEPEGWGGREAIGGSPRGQEMTEAQLKAAAEKVASLIKKEG
jgi:hypothetical protein